MRIVRMLTIAPQIRNGVNISIAKAQWLWRARNILVSVWSPGDDYFMVW